MFDPLPPTLPVEPTALLRTATVVISGLLAWVAWVFLRTPVRPQARFVDVPEPEPPPADAVVEKSEETKGEESKPEPTEEAKTEEPKAEPKEEPKAEAKDE